MNKRDVQNNKDSIPVSPCLRYGWRLCCSNGRCGSPHCCNKWLMKATSGRKVSLAYSSTVQFYSTVHQTAAIEVEGCWLYCIHRQEAKRDKQLVLSPHPHAPLFSPRIQHVKWSYLYLRWVLFPPHLNFYEKTWCVAVSSLIYLPSWRKTLYKI